MADFVHDEADESDVSSEEGELSDGELAPGKKSKDKPKKKKAMQISDDEDEDEEIGSDIL